MAELNSACFVDSELLGARLTLETAGWAIGDADVVEILPFLRADDLQYRCFIGIAAAVEFGVISSVAKG